MKQLIGAIGSRLASLYGTSKVYFGDAEESAAFPYVVYSVQSGNVTQYSTCDRDAGAVQTTAVQISTWTKSSVTATDRVEEIAKSFHNTALSMSTYKFLRAELIDKTVFVDPDRDQDGQRVWQGVCIFEFVWCKGE